MDSSFRTERAATATTAVTTTSIISGTPRGTGRPATDTRHELCWCGQDMDVVHGTHCPRCGTMRPRRVEARVGAALPRLAA